MANMQTLYYLIVSIACIGIFILLVVKIKGNFSSTLIYFIIFYFISVFHILGAGISRLLMNSSIDFHLVVFWKYSLAISRIRYIFFILFIHSLYKFPYRIILNAFFSMLIVLCLLSPFFVYSFFPQLMELFVLIYSFAFLIFLYVWNPKPGIDYGKKRLLQSLVVCNLFFIVGMTLDFLEEIPVISVYLSLYLIDFYPAYILCLGFVFIRWLFKSENSYENTSDAVHFSFFNAVDVSSLPLSRREAEVVTFMLKGDNNKDIGRQLFISESTVKKHINSIFKKLKISSRWELIKLSENFHPKE